MSLCCAENFGQRGSLKLFLNRRKTFKKPSGVRVGEWEPNILFPVLPKQILIVDKSADLLEKLPSTRNQKSLDAALLDVLCAEAHILLAMINPVDLRVSLSTQNQVLLVIIWSNGVNELADAAMLGIVGVHAIFLLCGLDWMLNDPSRQTTLSNLGDKVPVRLVMRTVSAMLGFVRPMPNGAAARSLCNKRLLTNRTPRIRVIGVVVVPDSFPKVVVDHGIIFCSNVPDDGSPLAFGTKGCSAADVPKVPQAW